MNRRRIWKALPSVERLLRGLLGIHSPSPSKEWLEWSRQLTVPPWPVVPECHGHKGDIGPISCTQCDGSHEHAWVPFGRAVRCRSCGARKCDRAGCISRRHHYDSHLTETGAREPLGGGPDAV